MLTKLFEALSLSPFEKRGLQMFSIFNGLRLSKVAAHSRAIRTSTNRIFERPSIKAIRESTYQRLPKDAKLSGIKTCRTFRFRLDPVAIEMPASVSDSQD